MNYDYLITLCVVAIIFCIIGIIFIIINTNKNNDNITITLKIDNPIHVKVTNSNMIPSDPCANKLKIIKNNIVVGCSTEIINFGENKT